MALSENQLARLWVQAGGPPRLAALMAKIAKRESGGNPGAQNLKYPDHSIGLWQINQLAHKGRYGSDSKLKDPLANAKAAVAVYRGSGNSLRPWSTYNPSVDKKYIGQPAQRQSAIKAGTYAPPAAALPSSAVPSDARQQIALSLLGLGGLGGSSGGGDDLTTSLLQAASQQADRPKARKVRTDPPVGPGSKPQSYGAGNADLRQLAEVAQKRFGLTIREFAPYDKVDPVHTKGSFHYSNRAFDASGPPGKLVAYNKWLAKNYGKKVAEMFYDPGINIDKGRPVRAIGGHPSHVHVAL